MVLYSEQTRKLSSETSLIDDGTGYAVPHVAYGTVKDFGTVTVPVDGLLCFNFHLRNSSVSTISACLALLVDGLIPYTVEFHSTVAGTDEEHKIFVPVAAGNHTVAVNGKASASGYLLENFRCGVTLFSDYEYTSWGEYASALTVNCPSRNTPLGTLAYATLVITAGAFTVGDYTEMENNGESRHNGVKLKVNGSYVSWTSRQQGDANISGCSGLYVAVVPVDTDYTVTFEKDNAATDVYVAVTICPWLLTGSNTSVSTFPVAADFPPNSTLYITLEPLVEDVTSFAAIGKPRCISFGDSTDYYEIAEATGINSLTYTFELVSPDNVGCYVGGYGACIAYIGVDVV